MRKTITIFLLLAIQVTSVSVFPLCASTGYPIPSILVPLISIDETQCQSLLIGTHLSKSSLLCLPFVKSRKDSVSPKTYEEATVQEEIGAHRLMSFMLAVVAISLLFLLFILSRTIQQKKVSHEMLIKRNKEIKEINDQLKHQNEEIEAQKENIALQNQQLVEMHSELNMLLGIVAHDLRSPLNNIRGLLKVIQLNDENLTDEQTKYLEMIMTASVRLSDMVTKILNSNSFESNMLNLNLKLVDIIPLLKEVINNQVAIANNKSIQIHLSSNCIECKANIDEELTIQVFENLISNAIKFSPFNKNIYINIVLNNGTLQIEIKDEGPGISGEDMPKLFGKYQKLSARPTAGEPSLGLGLSLVKRYVETMKGQIRCESILGAGASFIVSLPVPE